MYNTCAAYPFQVTALKVSVDARSHTVEIILRGSLGPANGPRRTQRESERESERERERESEEEGEKRAKERDKEKLRDKKRERERMPTCKWSLADAK